MTTESLRTTPAQRNFIKVLFAKNSGELGNEQLIKAAEAPDSPIHDLFIWNNRRAGHLYRMRQAARILRSYTGWFPAVVKGGSKQKATANVQANRVPIAVKVRPAKDEAPKWVQTSNALDNEFMRLQVISDRIGRVRSAIEQLRVVPELEDLYDQLKLAIDRYKVPVVQKKAKA